MFFEASRYHVKVERRLCQDHPGSTLRGEATSALRFFYVVLRRAQAPASSKKCLNVREPRHWDGEFG